MADADPPGDLFDRLRLIRSSGVGPVTYRHLMRRFGTARLALEALPDLARLGRGGGLGGRAARLADPAIVSREIDAVARLGARHLFLDDADYPALLAQMDDAPAVLTIRGQLPPATGTSVAIVGARNASAAACRFARGLAHDLAREGVTVVSGLARGIDTAAHMGAGAATVAVIAGGIDVAYPPENRELQERIASDALLVAEMPPGTEPRARHFPYRNRIIAGLAHGTLVVEAAPKSGSLITARLANEAGRDVMAVPGSPLDPRAQGCNLLIREGATLIQTAADVIEQIRPLDPRLVRASASAFVAQPPADADDAARRAVTDLLGPVPVAVDELIRQSGVAAPVVQMVLLELEIAGRLERHAGGRASLVA